MLSIGGQKTPGTKSGVVSLFAVTHQGPAQGGKAGNAFALRCNVASHGWRKH